MIGIFSKQITLLGLGLLIGTAICAQDQVFKKQHNLLKDLTMTNTITKTLGDSVLVFHVKVESPSIDHDFKKRYYWFYQGEIKSAQGTHSGKLLEGPYEKYNRKRVLLEKGEFLQGLKDGTWLTWHANGNVASKTEWKDGYRQGVCQTFFPSGTRQSVEPYRDHVLHGKRVFYSEGGEITFSQTYRKGKLVTEKVKKVKEPVPARVRHPRKTKTFNDSTMVVVPPTDSTVTVPLEKKKKKKDRTIVTPEGAQQP
jgi:antitoxin component YwqK of YwqJK toxin-antitoxin module